MSLASSNSGRATADAAAGESDVGDSEAGGKARDEGPGDESAVSLVRIERLRDSMPGKESLIGELIDLFVADLPKRLSAITQSVDCSDGRALALEAHALRGSAANFGARRLDQLCGGLEEIGARGTLAEASATLCELTDESARVREALLALKSRHPVTPPGRAAPAKPPRPV